MQILCQVHDNSTPFQWEYIERDNAAVQALYLTNYNSNLLLECFKDLKGVKSFKIIKQK